MRYPVAILLLAALAVPQESKPHKGTLSEEDFKALHKLSREKRPKPRGKMIQLKEAKAYLSLPAKGKAPFPAVVVIHEWWGLNEHIRYWADRLADDGYAALAVDLYGGKVANNRDDAMKYMRAVDDKKALAVLKEAHAFLAKDPRIQAKKRASVGWCFGGGWSLQLALNAPDLDVAVVYYGRLVTDAEKLKMIKADVLGIFAKKDGWITPRLVKDFEGALKKAKVKHALLSYDAKHAFANPSSDVYHEKSAADAWKHVRELFSKKLK